MLGCFNKKEKEKVQVIVEKPVAEVKEVLCYEVPCDITYHYKVDEDNPRTLNTFHGSRDFYELHCHLRVDCEINGKEYHLDSSFIRGRHENLDKLYMSIEEDLEDGEDIELSLRREARDMIETKLLNERAEKMKAFIQDNKEFKLVATIKVKK